MLKHPFGYHLLLFMQAKMTVFTAKQNTTKPPTLPFSHVKVSDVDAHGTFKTENQRLTHGQGIPENVVE